MTDSLELYNMKDKICVIQPKTKAAIYGILE